MDNNAFALQMLSRQNPHQYKSMMAQQKARQIAQKKARQIAQQSTKNKYSNSFKQTRKAAKKERRQSSTLFKFLLATPFFNTKGYYTNVSKAEKDTRMLFLGSLVDMVGKFKSSMMRPNYSSLQYVFNSLTPSWKFAPGVMNKYNIPSFGNQHASNLQFNTSETNYFKNINHNEFNIKSENENMVHDQMFKIMILTTIYNMFEDKDTHTPEVLDIIRELNKVSRQSNKLRIPKIGGEESIILQTAFDYCFPYHSPQLGGTIPLLTPVPPLLTTSTAPPLIHTPDIPIIQTSPKSEPKPETVYRGRDYRSDSYVPSIPERMLSQSQHNSLQRASEFFGIKGEVQGINPLSKLQEGMLSLASTIKGYTGLVIPYTPSIGQPVEPLVSREAQQKFAFVRGPLEQLKITLALHAPERFRVLQYNSIMNILQAIRIGKTHVENQVNLDGLSPVSGGDIRNIMHNLANYDPRYTNITIHVQRKEPTTLGKIVSYFKTGTNFVIENIYIMYTFNEEVRQKESKQVEVYDDDEEPYPVQNRFYMQFNQLQFNELEPFAARFVMPTIGKVADVIGAMKDLIEFDASFIGFYRPNTSIASILAALESTDEITRKVIANLAEFSKLAFELTRLRMADSMIAGLYQNVQDDSKAVEVRVKSYQLQQHIQEMTQEGAKWDVAPIEKLIKLASDMAVTSGQLDKTLNDDKAIAEFFMNVTAKFGVALKDGLEAVADTAQLIGGSARQGIGSLTDISKMLLRSETIFMYVIFFIYYLIHGSCTMKLLSVAAPLLNPVAPVIALESVFEGVSGIAPNKGTTIVMLYLFYRIWDKQKVESISNTIMELINMCRCRARGVPVSAAAASAPLAPPQGSSSSSAEPPQVSSSSSRGAPKTPRIRPSSSLSGQASASSSRSGHASASSSSSGHASASRGPRTPRSHVNAARSIAAQAAATQSRMDRVDEIRMRYPALEPYAENIVNGRLDPDDIQDIIRTTGLSFDDAVDLYRRRLDPRFVKSSMNMGLSYREVLSEVLQIRGGRRTRKNKRQNRRRTRK